MKSITNLIILSSILFFIVMPATVQGEDFTFTIPVELNNIPKELVSWSIFVKVWNSSNMLIAIGAKHFSVNGSLKIIYIVKFNAKPNINPASASRYDVQLMVRNPNNYKVANAKVVMRTSGPWPLDKTKPVVTTLQRRIW